MNTDSSISTGDAIVALLTATARSPYRALHAMMKGQDEWTSMNASIVVPASAANVMALLDPNSRRNRWIIRGDIFGPTGESNTHFRLVAQEAPEYPVILSVLDKRGKDMINLATKFESDHDEIKIIGSADTYRLTPTEDGKTHVALEMVVKFKPDLDAMTYAFHSELFRASGPHDLKRLKRECLALQ